MGWVVICERERVCESERDQPGSQPARIRIKAGSQAYDMQRAALGCCRERRRTTRRKGRMRRTAPTKARWRKDGHETN